MFECTNCWSERIFGGQCLDCGHKMEQPENVEGWDALQRHAPAGRPGLGDDPQEMEMPEATASILVADHYISFSVPEALKFVQPRSRAASIEATTTASMVRAVRRKPRQEPSDDMENHSDES